MQHLLGTFELILVLLCSCYGAKRSIPAFPYDCTQIKTESPEASSGVYMIQPAGVDASFKVYCQMQSDGGWNVVQRRGGPAQSFNKTWEEYKSGFGVLMKDHWLGLEKVYSLTKDNSRSWILKVDLWDHEGSSAFAEYRDFSLGNEEMNYTLHVGDYSGNAGDAIRGVYPGIDQNGFGFSTMDRDNDGCTPCIFGDIQLHECTSTLGGGWWYSQCGSASLNGVWRPSGDHTGWASGLHWRTWKPPAPYSARASRMMIMTVNSQKRLGHGGG